MQCWGGRLEIECQWMRSLMEMAHVFAFSRGSCSVMMWSLFDGWPVNKFSCQFPGGYLVASVRAIQIGSAPCIPPGHWLGSYLAVRSGGFGLCSVVCFVRPTGRLGELSLAIGRNVEAFMRYRTAPHSVKTFLFDCPFCVMTRRRSSCLPFG